MEEQTNQQSQTNADSERTSTENQNTNPAPAAAPMGEAPKMGNSDVEANKIMAIVGYILPILFFVPLINESSKNSPFARFHANQQLVLLIAAIVVDIVGSIIPILGWFIILPIGSVFLLVVAIIGIVGAAKGEMKPLPVIGGFKII